MAIRKRPAKDTKDRRGKSSRSSKPVRRRKQSKDNVEQALSGPLRRSPRPVPLPGLEDTRIEALDDVATSIADIRAKMAELRELEGTDLRTALKLMRDHGRMTWRAAGVELARVPGEEKLRVRTSKESATAESEEDDGDETVEATDAHESISEA